MDSTSIGMNIGIFGGTFDPPHLAHLILASEAQYQLNLHQVIWVLTPNPPHKGGRSAASLEDRLDMVTASIAKNQLFRLSRVEIDRPGPHFAADTVRLLADQFPYSNLIYLMGGDSLRDLPTWERPDEFLATCHALGVMRRPGDDINLSILDAQLPCLSNKIKYVEAPLIGISASDIRNRIVNRIPFRYYVHEAVYNLILERGLYRT
jgi:nicotinate-nucleotide adenylyltransferase